MSKDKNSVSPFTDKEYLQSSSSANNKYKKQVTEEDIEKIKKALKKISLYVTIIICGGISPFPWR